MERIEYLLNHPSTVEGSDLELLNNEIEKYPYFYSLRALKLVAIKKIKDDSFDNLLPLTATFSNDRKDLYQFINGKQKVNLFEDQQKEKILPIVEDEIFEEALPEIEEKTNLEIETKTEENLIPNDTTSSIQDLDVTEIKPDHIDIEDLTTEENIQEILEDKTEISQNQIEEEIIAEPTIESLIEEIIQENNHAEIEQQLVDFDYPEQPYQFKSEIENSVLVAENILHDKDVVNEAIKETLDLQNHSIEEEQLQEIEQVNLIGRGFENETQVQTSLINQKTVSNINIFQIQNTFDVVKGKIEDHIVPNLEEHPEEIIPETIIETTQNEIMTVIDVENNPVENIIQPKKLDTIEEIIPEKKSVERIQNESTSSLSFNDWLRKSDEATNPSTQKEMKYLVIDSFLEKNPKITPIKKIDIPEAKIDVKDIRQTDFSDLMTETLAQIYIEQKQYEKAIKAYKILSLKYPEKNSLFANQIKEIENLKNSK